MSTYRRGAALLLLCVAIACNDGGKKPAATSVEEVADRVGIVLPIATQPAYRTLEEGLVEGLREGGHEAVSDQNAATPADQAALIERITARKARAIVVAPLDSVTLRPAIDNALAASIPVFTVGLRVEGAQVTTHMEPDRRGTGVIAAEYLSAFVGPGVHAGIIGRLQAYGSSEIRAGFDSVMAQDTRVNAGAGESGGTSEGAAAATSAMLDRDPGLKGIVALDPVSAQGVMSALFARRRADVAVVSVGATQETLEAIRSERVLHAAIVERVDEGARLLAAAINTQLEGEPVTPSIKVPVRLINIDSVRARPGNQP